MFNHAAKEYKTCKNVFSKLKLDLTLAAENAIELEEAAASVAAEEATIEKSDASGFVTPIQTRSSSSKYDYLI